MSLVASIAQNLLLLPIVSSTAHSYAMARQRNMLVTWVMCPWHCVCIIQVFAICRFCWRIDEMVHVTRLLPSCGCVTVWWRQDCWPTTAMECPTEPYHMHHSTNIDSKEELLFTTSGHFNTFGVNFTMDTPHTHARTHTHTTRITGSGWRKNTCHKQVTSQGVNVDNISKHM